MSVVVLATGILMGLAPTAASAAEPPLSPRTRSIQGEIITYYKYALNRAPGVSSFRYWVNLTASRCYPSFGGVPAGLWTSSEFRARSLTRAQRVQTLYRGLLARTGSSTEVASWVNAMRRGTSWSSVVSGFAKSTEYRGRVSRICAVHANPRLFITEADQLLGVPFGLWRRHRALRMQVTDPYDWSTNGCSLIGDIIPLFDYRVCWRHDWGYRNFGRGLRLDRTDSRRRIIDDVLLQDMNFSCGQRYTGGSWGHVGCLRQASTVYRALRLGGDYAFYG